jgi:hypothetical protein
MTLEPTDPIMHLDEVRPLVDLEFERARRYGRPLGIAVLHRGAPEHAEVRVPDLLVRIDSDRTALIAPETTGTALRTCARRVAAEARADLLGTADFPADGPVFEALLVAAHDAVIARPALRST